MKLRFIEIASTLLNDLMYSIRTVPIINTIASCMGTFILQCFSTQEIPPYNNLSELEFSQYPQVLLLTSTVILEV